MDWGNVKKLRLTNNKIGSAQLQILLANKWPKLQFLSLSKTPINSCNNILQDKGLQKLLAWLHSRKPNIKALLLDYNKISSHGIKTFLNYSFKHITELGLSGNVIGNSGVKLLVKACVPCLEKLWLNSCQIGNQGAMHLCKSQWPQLTQLSILSQYIKYDGYLKMINQAGWPQLKVLAVLDMDFITALNVVMSDWPKYLKQQMKSNCGKRRKFICIMDEILGEMFQM